MTFRMSILAIVAMALVVTMTTGLRAADARPAAERQIPVDDIDNWYCEYFGGGGLCDGARREVGAGLGTTALYGMGNMAFDDYGNTCRIAGACRRLARHMKRDGRWDGRA